VSRSKAYFINGGAGRVLCSIPAFEKLAETDDDFIIVCEGGSNLYRGHPKLDHRAYDNWHKGLFHDKLKDRDLISLEPYRVWEYYNQKCSLSQAFDIEINQQGIRELPAPSIYVNKVEIAQALGVINEVKARSGFDKVIIVQPFGRTAQNTGGMIVDPTSRSFALGDIREVINDLKKDYGIIFMTDFPVDLGEDPEKAVVAMPQIPDLRIWAAVFELADHFIGCDSVGQHIARALGKTATVVTGSTFPVNVSYPDCADFDVIDAGKGRRTYSPIRISQEDAIDRMNDHCMDLESHHIDKIIASSRKRLGKSVKAKIVPTTKESTIPPMSFTQTAQAMAQEKATEASFKVIGAV
jgi:hypothetical protein